MAKKLDEIKEAISANSTPVKGPLERDHVSEDDLLNNDTSSSRSRRVSGELDLWGRLSESRKSSYNNLVPLGENTTSNNLNAYPTLPDSVYPSPNEVNLIGLWIAVHRVILFFIPAEPRQYNL